MNYELIDTTSLKQGVSTLAVNLVECIQFEMLKAETVNILMSGGNTPLYLYQELLTKHAKDIDWRRCRIIILDERFVPFESTRSNAGECYRNFASHVSLKQFIYPDTAMPIEECLISFSNAIKLIDNETIHLALLGTANDGHIASIFPDMDITASAKHCFSCLPENTTEHRLSLTLDYINRSKHIWMMAFGKNKQKIIQKVKENSPSRLPALSLKSSNPVKWFINE